MKNILAILTMICAAFLCASCWQAAAARAAKKRTTQTGPVMGTLENELGVEDPLGREQKTLTEKSPADGAQTAEAAKTAN